MFQRSKKVEQGLTRTRQSFFGRIGQIFGRATITPEDWENLEEILIQADVGVETTVELVEKVRRRAESEKLSDAASIQRALQEEMAALLPLSLPPSNPDGLEIMLIVGVNGVGKTTSIAKLANYLKGRGRSVVIAAGDTFRAAAGEQIGIWGERINVPVIGAGANGADPGAVVFDAVNAAQARHADILIVDTAGRLHTKFNLMEELKKIRRVAKKALPTARQQALLVIDATTGQNGLTQARQFTAATPVTGIILTKLDGTAKGGIVFAICKELGIPITYVGTGEKLDDFAEFDPQEFVSALFR